MKRFFKKLKSPPTPATTTSTGAPAASQNTTAGTATMGVVKKNEDGPQNNEADIITIGKKVSDLSPFSSTASSMSSGIDGTHGAPLPKFTLLDQVVPDRQKILECAVCSTTSVPPVYVCGEGHNVCHLCHTVGEACTCGSGFTRVRNEAVEHLVSELRFKCFFDGCTRPILGREVKSHLKSCDFRPIVCKIHNDHYKESTGQLSCHDLVPIDEYMEHLQQKHDVLGIDASSTVVDMSTTVRLGQGNWTFPPQYLNAFGKTFLCHFHASYNLILGWISLCGPAEEAAKFAGSVTIFHPLHKWKQVKWMGPVHSFRSTSEKVYESGNCLILLPETFLLFARFEGDEAAGAGNKWSSVDASKRIKKWICHFEVSHIQELEKQQQDADAENNHVASGTDISTHLVEPAGEGVGGP